MSNPALRSIAGEINAAHANAIQHADTAIGHARQAGELLLMVKEIIPHGEFLPWIDANCTVSPRQAQRYMAAAQGKPTPLRAIKPAAIKNDTVSHFHVTDGEAVHLTRLAGSWRDEVWIFPSGAPEFFHYAHMTGIYDKGGSCTYTKRPVSRQGIYFMLLGDINWGASEIRRFAYLGCAENPMARIMEEIHEL